MSGQLAEGFNRQMTRYRYLAMLHWVKGPRILELGCGKGDLTQQLRRCGEVVALDSDMSYLREAGRVLGREWSFGHPVTLKDCFVEDFKPEGTFNTIVAVDLLEHLTDPCAMLEKLPGWLSKRGHLIVVVPNARSLHRLLGLDMGLIQGLRTLGQQDLEVEHKRWYDAQLLRKHVGGTGLKVVFEDGILLKPLPNPQMGNSFPSALLDVLFKVGSYYPANCAELLCVAEKDT